MFLHTSYADLRDIPDLHAQHPAAAQDQVAVAACGESLILPLLHEALQAHVLNSIGAHSCSRLDDPAQFIHCKKTLFHLRNGFHIRADGIAMAEDRPDVLLGNTCRTQTKSSLT